MAYYLPQRRETFARINGVGAAKLEEYGEAFLAVIRHHAHTHELKERAIAPRRRERNPSVNRRVPTIQTTKRLLSQKLSVSEIAEQRGLTEGTVINHLERLASAGEKLDLAHVMPAREYLARIEAAFLECGSQFLAPVLDFLGQAYSYDDLRLVRIYLRQKKEVTSQEPIT